MSSVLSVTPYQIDRSVSYIKTTGLGEDFCPNLEYLESVFEDIGLVPILLINSGGGIYDPTQLNYTK